MFFNWILSSRCETNIYLIILGYLALLLPLITSIIVSIIFIIKFNKMKKAKRSMLVLIVKILLTIWLSVILSDLIFRLYSHISDKIHYKEWPQYEWCGFGKE